MGVVSLKILKVLKLIILWIISAIAIVILSIAFIVLVSFIQTKLFMPKEYIMWVNGFLGSRLSLVYEIYIVFGFFYIFNKAYKDNREFMKKFFKEKIIKNHKKAFIYTFLALNIVLMYTVLFNVTVITNNKIIDHTFLSPQGKEYSYSDIKKIDTGVYGKKMYLPFTHSRGEWFYIVELNDGNKIDLTKLGGTKIEDDDERFIIEKLDRQFVNMNIPKVSSMDNFEYCAKDLNKIYSDKIRSILLN